MFKFSFEIDRDGESAFNNEDTTQSSKELELPCHDCVEIFPVQKHLDNLDGYHSEVLPVGTLHILHLRAAALKTCFQFNSKGEIGKAESNHTDLIPGVYEGGAKIWECTEDVIKYFDKNDFLHIFKEKSVLDLGCGAGILGVYALKSNATKVHFQDYNEDVLDNITIPTVLVNSPIKTLQAVSNKSQFYSGDWSKYIESTKNDEKFDVIITSETIYNSANHKKLLNTLDKKLKADGFVLLAAKIYYFGVGGGLRQFEELIERDKRFRCESVWKSEDSVSREILKINRIN